MAVRRSSGTIWDSAACSIARNGPTSLPVGEMTPIVAARISRGTQSVSAKATPAHDHQDRAGHQDAAPAEPIGMRRQPQREDRVADEREAEHDPDRQGVESERVEVQHERDGEEAVAEHPQRPHGEQRPTVAVQAAQAGDETGIDWRRGARRGHGSGVYGLIPPPGRSATIAGGGSRHRVTKAKHADDAPGHEGAVGHHRPTTTGTTPDTTTTPMPEDRSARSTSRPGGLASPACCSDSP